MSSFWFLNIQFTNTVLSRGNHFNFYVGFPRFLFTTFGTNMHFSSCCLSLSRSSYGSRDSYWPPLSLSSLTSRKHETWLETVGCLTFYTFLVDMFTSIPTHLQTTALNFHIFRCISKLNQTLIFRNKQYILCRKRKFKLRLGSFYYVRSKFRFCQHIQAYNGF